MRGRSEEPTQKKMRGGGFKEHSCIGKVQRRDTEAKSSGGYHENEPLGRSYLHDPHLPLTAKADHSSPRGGTKPTGELSPTGGFCDAHLQLKQRSPTWAEISYWCYLHGTKLQVQEEFICRGHRKFMSQAHLPGFKVSLTDAHLGKFNFYNSCYKC